MLHVSTVYTKMIKLLELDFDTHTIYKTGPKKVPINVGPELVNIVLQWSKFNNKVAN